MKRLIAITALSLTAFTGAASAMTAANAGAISTIERYAPNVAPSQLTDPQVLSVLNAIHSADSGSQARAAVRALVGETS